MSGRTVCVDSNGDGDTIRLRLGVPSYGRVNGRISEHDRIATGVFARALWIGRKYVVLLTYSQWVDDTGAASGDGYRLCTARDTAMIRSQFGASAAERALDVFRVPVRNIDGERVES